MLEAARTTVGVHNGQGSLSARVLRAHWVKHCGATVAHLYVTSTKLAASAAPSPFRAWASDSTWSRVARALKEARRVGGCSLSGWATLRLTALVSIMIGGACAEQPRLVAADLVPRGEGPVPVRNRQLRFKAPQVGVNRQRESNSTRCERGEHDGQTCLGATMPQGCRRQPVIALNFFACDGVSVVFVDT